MRKFAKLIITNRVVLAYEFTYNAYNAYITAQIIISRVSRVNSMRRANMNDGAIFCEVLSVALCSTVIIYYKRQFCVHLIEPEIFTSREEIFFQSAEKQWVTRIESIRFAEAGEYRHTGIPFANTISPQLTCLIRTSTKYYGTHFENQSAVNLIPNKPINSIEYNHKISSDKQCQCTSYYRQLF